ncbi:Tat binding protein 1(TBP-1)-interacting protein [Necator americanus]|nr:Tat binding protein 1(TBP-1)-interacting protein [Necator americanus]ETN86136.1 Tat binding protein 1(TBP-1)-interacting protein [Necator americanus]
MVEQNRPYSANDVYSNLRQEFSKALVVKVLDASVTSGVLKEKVIGKQKIYYTNQDNLEKCDESAIAEYDAKVDKLSEKLAALSSRHKELQNELKTLSSTETTERLSELTTELKEKIKHLKAELAKWESTDQDAVLEESRKTMELEASLSKMLVKRKRIALEMLNAISENSPMTKQELVDRIGIELEPGEW